MSAKPASEPERLAQQAGHDSGEIIRVADRFYILATSTLADERSRVLKEGETFAVFDVHGDVRQVGLGEEGIFHEGTRYLSLFHLRLARKRPMFLSSVIKQDNAFLAVDLTNPDMYLADQVMIPRGTLHLLRTRFLWNAVSYERIRLRNFGLSPLEISVGVHFDADFADIFEVRGARRDAKGKRLPAVVEEATVVIAYEGLDGVTRRTRLEFWPTPTLLTGTDARFDVALRPCGEVMFYITLACETTQVTPHLLSYDAAAEAAGKSLKSAEAHACHIYTSNEQFNGWANRSAADLHMMTTKTPQGPYPYAGVPWFSTAFGRDGLITALECLWLKPEMARGVLAFLAANQADKVIAEQDAEPGKILHETRKGEMAALGEIPFGRYYGSVDSTPLFVMLAHAYYHRTGDRDFIKQLWPHVERALEWIDRHGDADHDGFVEYARMSPKGLTQQGWKDSQDSVFHADGTLAEGPIALCEVQGYVYAAKMGAGRLAAALGYAKKAGDLEHEAEALQKQFEERFWLDDLSTYALALDGKKQPCRVRTSNAGQCLFTGITSAEHARIAAATLMGRDSYSGWGVRTLSASEVRYNPMSYHNGSVWPHDNALIAHGFARYGLRQEVSRLLVGLFDASLFVEQYRMPELFCGFARRPEEGPTLYPVACSPQSWAAAAVYLLLQSCLGLEIDGVRSRISFSYPTLPECLPEVEIRNLRVGSATVDLQLERHTEDDVGVNVLRRDGKVDVIVVK